MICLGVLTCDYPLYMYMYIHRSLHIEKYDTFIFIYNLYMYIYLYIHTHLYIYLQIYIHTLKKIEHMLLTVANIKDLTSTFLVLDVSETS